MLVVEAVNVSIDVGSIGFVAEGPTEKEGGRRVESRPASGGHSVSAVDGKGHYEIELSDPLDRGRRVESAAVNMLVDLLRARGEVVTLKEGAADSRGEDRLLSVIGRGDFAVQVVTLPADEQPWRTLGSMGHAAMTGTMDNAVKMVRDALERKRGSAGGAILVLAAAHLGAIAGEALVRAYLAAHGDPDAEYPFAEIWIIGPTVHSSVKLAAS